MRKFSVHRTVEEYVNNKKIHTIKVHYLTDGEFVYPFDYISDCKEIVEYDGDGFSVYLKSKYLYVLQFKYCDHFVVMEVTENKPNESICFVYTK